MITTGPRLCSIMPFDQNAWHFILEVGHGLELSTKKPDHHDDGLWPTELPQGKTGLMFWAVDNATYWIRQEDWKKANDSSTRQR